MDKQLNTNGNAFLLSNLKQDLHIQYHNYLKETLEKTRKNRNYLKCSYKEKKDNEGFVVLQYQLVAKENILAN
jgi:hypothetical protein